MGPNVFGKTRVNLSCLSLFAIVIHTINYSTSSLNYSTSGDPDLRISRAPHVRIICGYVRFAAHERQKSHGRFQFSRSAAHIYLSIVSDTGGFLARFSKGSVSSCRLFTKFIQRPDQSVAPPTPPPRNALIKDKVLCIVNGLKSLFRVSAMTFV